MTKTITKQAFAVLFAAMFAALMALALAPSAYAEGEDVAFTVFKQVATGVDADGNVQYGDATAEKTYTIEELKAIATTKEAAEAPGYNKYAKNDFAYAATSYVELAQFAKDAGVANVGDITLMRFINGGSFSYAGWKDDPSILKDALWHKENNITHEDWSGISGAELASDLMFFPNQRTDSDEPSVKYSTEGAVAVPSVLALAYGKQQITSGMTAADARNAAAGLSAEDTWIPLFGNTAEYFSANGPQMGNTIPTGVKGVLILVNSIEGATVSDIAAATYTGKAITPAMKVTLGSAALVQGKDFTVSYKNNVNAGTATVTVAGAGNFTGSITKTFKINKADQTIAAKSFSKKLKAKKGKLAKKATLNVETLGKVNAPATAKYAKVGKTGGSKIAVSKAGKITVKKGLKKGKYVVKIKITATGDANHNAAPAKTIKATITVK